MIATAGQMAGAAQILDLITKGEFEVLDDMEDFLYDEILWKKDGIDRWVTIGARVQGGEALIDCYRSSRWATHSAMLHIVRPAGELPDNMTLEIAYPDPNQPHLWKPLSVTVTEMLICPEQIIEAITAKHQEA